MVTGFKGLIKDFIAVDEQYEKAIYAALGNATNNVIIATNFDAQQAINMLKQNNGGKATFLPLDDIRPRGIKEEYIEVLENSPGYKGIAAELIKYPKEFDAAYRHVLGSTIIADTIDNAILISRLTFKLYRVFSLDGDVVNPGGSITGGFNKNNYDRPKMSVEDLSKLILDKENELISLRLEFDNFCNEQNETLNKVNNKNNQRTQYADSIVKLEASLYNYELEFKQYAAQDKDKDGGKAFESELTTNISKLQTKSDKLSGELSVMRQQKALLQSKINDHYAKLSEDSKQLDNCRMQKLASVEEKITCENKIENSKEKINSVYKLTLEYVKENYREELPMSDDQARAMIAKLQHEIDSLGDINFEAIKDLDSRQKQYEDDVKQLDELKAACDKIKDAIKKLDVKAKKDFIDTINNVNNTLPEIFKFLYGGGSCEVTLTDPNDYLNTGIEITVTLPGKTTMPLYLYSGGEQTLITLSILFSILKNKSFPLVILDEAEGALDVANVLRFGQIIRAYSKNTQFVVITHRGGTME
jgi:chromosome segregation protein